MAMPHALPLLANRDAFVPETHRVSCSTVPPSSSQACSQGHLSMTWMNSLMNEMVLSSCVCVGCVCQCIFVIIFHSPHFLFFSCSHLPEFLIFQIFPFSIFSQFPHVAILLIFPFPLLFHIPNVASHTYLVFLVHPTPLHFLTLGLLGGGTHLRCVHFFLVFFHLVAYFLWGGWRGISDFIRHQTFLASCCLHHRADMPHQTSHIRPYTHTCFSHRLFCTDA